MKLHKGDIILVDKCDKLLVVDSPTISMNDRWMDNPPCTGAWVIIDNTEVWIEISRVLEVVYSM